MKRDSIVHIIVHIISDLKVSPGSISGDLQALVEMSNGNCSVSKEGNGIWICVLVTTWRIPKMGTPKSSKKIESCTRLQSETPWCHKSESEKVIDKIVHYKSSILGVPPFMKIPIYGHKVYSHGEKMMCERGFGFGGDQNRDFVSYQVVQQRAVQLWL